MEHRFECGSGRVSMFMLRSMLKLSIAPGLAVTDGKLFSSRKSMDRWGVALPPVTGVTVSKETLVGLACESHTPQRSHSNRVILYFHGGGFCVGSPASHRNLVSRIAAASGIKTVAVDYRLSPEHQYPAALEDTVTLYRYFLGQGFKPGNIVFAGDSAGGNLVVTTLLRIKQEGLPMPAAGCAISPWCDLTLQGGSIMDNAGKDLILSPTLLQDFADCYVPESERKRPDVSPVFADLDGLPPLLIQVGSHEILLGDACTLARRAEQAGVDVTLEIWDRMQHVWHYSAFLLKDGRAAIDRMATFINGLF